MAMFANKKVALELTILGEVLLEVSIFAQTIKRCKLGISTFCANNNGFIVRYWAITFVLKPRINLGLTSFLIFSGFMAALMADHRFVFFSTFKAVI